ECVAVGRRPDRSLGSDVAGSAGAILDDDLLAKPLRQPLTQQAADHVLRAAGGKADEQTHRPRRISLRRSDTRDRRERGSAPGQMEKISAGKFHFEPPFTSFDHLVGALLEKERHVEVKSLSRL